MSRPRVLWRWNAYKHRVGFGYRPDARQLGWQVAGVRGMFIMWAEALPGFSCVLVHNPNWRPGKAFL